jgi:hypothetical protein
MAKTKEAVDPVLRELTSIRQALEDLFILQALSLGAKRDDIRVAMTTADNNRISRINQCRKKADKHGEEET